MRRNITTAEKTQVAAAILKARGTDLYEQIITRVCGAEDIAVKLLDSIPQDTGKRHIAGNGFDIGKYVN
ncbi:hypothetical protein D0T84_19515 [Dysgonomonas sp. 521]|uniref:hypothetical protein n=1 Tax=Dysgonomonas sp. 521 TaxID=2302932 RepID=UPI0013D6509C|nr:hypothetical protein [Dysgonomonas sp. 521]NDV97076.1 hypothetical protein [Dysgonomonas sp. 521]